MNKTRAVFTAYVALLALIGCSSENAKEEAKIHGTTVNVVTVRGHDYVAMSQAGIIHAESCHCKEVKSNTGEGVWKHTTTFTEAPGVWKNGARMGKLTNNVPMIICAVCGQPKNRMTHDNGQWWCNEHRPE